LQPIVRVNSQHTKHHLEDLAQNHSPKTSAPTNISASSYKALREKFPVKSSLQGPDFGPQHQKKKKKKKKKKVFSTKP
jgi:hypothetical protein